MNERDKAEFKRLRHYYLYNFKHGKSDELFIKWCEGMCEEYTTVMDDGIPQGPLCLCCGKPIRVCGGCDGTC
jgi:hypothetical protein